MIKIFAVICKIAAPSDCIEQTVTGSDFAALTITGCLIGMPQLAKWMEGRPGYRLASWKCSIGGADRRGA